MIVMQVYGHPKEHSINLYVHFVIQSKIQITSFQLLLSFWNFREVLCLEFLYLRLLTGCGDGKIRIWSILSGSCLRVMRGNSISDPVTGLVATPNRFLVFSSFIPNRLLSIESLLIH